MLQIRTRAFGAKFFLLAVCCSVIIIGQTLISMKVRSSSEESLPPYYEVTDDGNVKEIHDSKELFKDEDIPKSLKEHKALVGELCVPDLVVCAEEGTVCARYDGAFRCLCREGHFYN